MKRVIQTVSLIILSTLYTQSQSVELLSLGSGELPVTAKGATKDENGNTYHFGDFRGAFEVEGNILLYGNGGNDLFMYKTSPNGQAVWAKQYGTESSEFAVSKLFYYKNNLYGICRIFNNTRISDLDVALVNSSVSSDCLVKFDSSGKAIWILPTNAGLTPEIQFFNNKLRIQGAISKVAGPVYIKDSVILGSTGFNNRFFIDIDLNGNIEKVYNVFQNNQLTTGFSLQAVANFQHNQFYLLVQTTNAGIQPGNNKLRIHETEINIPHTLNAILVKMDSNFNIIQHKILNPTGGSFSLSLSQDRLSANEAGDSLFLLLNSVFGYYVVDQFNTNVSGKCYMATFDTSLITRSLEKLSAPTAGANYPEINYYNLVHHQGAKYFFGVFKGRNQVKSVSEIIPEIVNINIFKNTLEPLNLNGPSMSFVVKEVSGNIQNIQFLGDHSYYEEDFIRMSGFEANNGELTFVNPTDDRWKPWKLNNNLEILSGGMANLTDKTETISRVQYFEGGAKLIVGNATGKTIFEEDTEQSLNSAKPDLFFAVLNLDNSLKKYHRIFSSFRLINLLKQVKKGNKIYLLYNLASARNQPGQNFFTINGQTIFVDGNFSAPTINVGFKILFMIDEQGTLSFQNMYDLPIGPANSFDVFDNGDLLVVTASTDKDLIFEGVDFSAYEGFFAAKMNKNEITKLVKIYWPIFPNHSAENIQLLPGESNFIISTSTSLSGTISNTTLQAKFVNGNTVPILIENQYPGTIGTRGYLSFLKLNFEQIFNTSTLGPMYLHMPHTQVITPHGFYASFSNTAGIIEPLKYNGVEVSPNNSPVRAHLLKMDTLLNLKNEITFSSIGLNGTTIEFTPLRIIEKNGHLYVGGMQRKALKFGAITIPYLGEADGLALKIDSGFNLLKYFKIQSLNWEQITDLDIYNDSVISFAAISYSSPNFIIGPLIISHNNEVRQGDLGPVHYLANVAIQNFPADLITTRKNGNWHDSDTWTTGAVPGNDARVVIKHHVQIEQAVSCKAVFMNFGSQIHVKSGIAFHIKGENNN